MATSDHEPTVGGRDTDSRPRHSSPPDSSRDVANEDFLFHLYRGSELLQDNRILEAKSELEHALTLQPRDPKGQDLLAVVYFRIGLYPRAIQIYNELLRENPKDQALKLNLALCYLKTGQAQAAREELESVVTANPSHKRAWGYLGLAFERLGDIEKALTAFQRGGHEAMVKRLSERAARSARPTIPPQLAATLTEPPSRAESQSVREVATVAFEELDAGDISFALAEQETSGEGVWHSTEPGAMTAAAPPRFSSRPPSLAPASGGPPGLESTSPKRRPRYDTLEFGLVPGSERASVRSGAPRSLADVTREALLAFPGERLVTLLPSGLALIQTEGAQPPPAPSTEHRRASGSSDEGEARQAGVPTEPGQGQGFAIRLEAIRSYTGTPTTNVMVRQIRGQSSNETFGGIGTPVVSVSGATRVVVGPRPGYHLIAFQLKDDVAFTREEHVFGFDLHLAYENGRLAVGDGDAALMVQLRGTGTALLELAEPLAALEVTASRPVSVRRESIVGWVGRLVPRVLSLGEAPCGQRGLVSFSGEGTVLLSAK